MKKTLMVSALFCSLLTAFPIYSTQSLITARADATTDVAANDADDDGNTNDSVDNDEGTEADAEEDQTDEGETSENEDTDSNSQTDEDGNSQNDSSENDTLREDNDDDDLFNNFILYNFIWYNVFDKSMTETERKSQDSVLPMLQYYHNLNSKRPIYQQLNPQKDLFWMNSWMLNPKSKAEKKVLIKNHLNSEAINKKFGKTYWIIVGSKVINVPLKIYQKIKVGDKVQMVDNHYLKINQKMYYVK